MSSTRDDPVLGAHREIYRASTRSDVDRFLSKCAGFAQCEVDLRGLVSKAELLKAAAVGMAFPEYFGMNWDALDECLAELIEHEPGGVAVVLRIDEDPAIEEYDWKWFIRVFVSVADEAEQIHGKVFALAVAQ